MMIRKRAFTLIELLIVVAIIAVLAAIALPNLLEAQTRAKVSRAKSDLRSLATAIETYIVDSNRVPYDGDPGDPHRGWVNSYARLTTPIQYFSSILADPFQDDTLAPPGGAGQHHHLDPPRNSVHSYDYGSANWHGVFQNSVERATWESAFGISLWKIGSAGPDLRFDDGGGSFYGFRARYDPTNGTTSAGDVYRSQARTE